MNKNKIPIAFIGAGYISEWHMRAIKKLKHLQLIAICDQDLMRAQSIAKTYGNLRCYTSWEQMFANEKLACVHILLPPLLHYQAIKYALEANAHVFVEKPFTFSSEEARDLKQIAQIKGLHIGVNHNFLFYPIYEECKHIIQSNQLGPLKQITIKWNKELLQINKTSLDQWPLKEPSQIILEAGVHSVANLLDLIGLPETFQVQVSSPFPETESPNVYRHWQIQGLSGSVPFTLQYHFGPCFDEHSIHLEGQIGNALIDYEGNRLVVRKHTSYNTNFDRYLRAKSEANSIKSQAWKNLKNFIYETCGFQAPGNAFGVSIRRSIETFYNKLDDRELDQRHSPGFSTEVVECCKRFVEKVQPPSMIGKSSTKRPIRNASEAEIVVFGGSGFIGKELIRQLVKEGESVKLICRNPEALPVELKSNPSVILQRGDIQDIASVESAVASAKVVYHLVTTGGRNWNESLQVDVNSSIALANACVKHNVQRLIYLGSIASYYSGSGATAIDEDTPFPDNIHKWQPYSRGKAMTEQKLMEIYEKAGLPIVIFRPGIVLGKESSPFHVGVGMWKYGSICQMWGDGNNPLPFVLVEDVARALIKGRSESNIEGLSFNLIGDVRLTAREYIQELSRAAQTEFEAKPTPIWRFYAADVAKWIVKSVLLYPNKQMPNYSNLESASQKAFYNNARAKDILKWNPIADKQEWVSRGIIEPVKQWLK